MSWAEVSKINNNFRVSLNEQARELAYSGSYLFTSSTNFSPEKSGYYKVICVGSGGTSGINSNSALNGGSGGVAISTLKLDKTHSYSISITNGTAIFNGETLASAITATAGENAVITGNTVNRRPGNGGTASGGDFNYPGRSGKSGNITYGADVGVIITELMQRMISFELDTYSSSPVPYAMHSGNGILGYGGGQACYGNSNFQVKSPVGDGCVLIIPLELVE